MNREHPVVWRATPLLVLPLLLSAACAPTSEAAADPADEDAARAEIAERRASFTETLRAGEAEPFLEYWTDDAYMREPGMSLDRAGLESFVAEFFATGRVLSLDIHPADVFVHGDVAYEFGEYEETIQVEGQEPFTVRNHHALRWERGDDGAWRIDRIVTGARDAPEGM